MFSSWSNWFGKKAVAAPAQQDDVFSLLQTTREEMIETLHGMLIDADPVLSERFAKAVRAEFKHERVRESNAGAFPEMQRGNSSGPYLSGEPTWIDLDQKKEVAEKKLQAILAECRVMVAANEDVLASLGGQIGRERDLITAIKKINPEQFTKLEQARIELKNIGSSLDQYYRNPLVIGQYIQKFANSSRSLPNELALLYAQEKNIPLPVVRQPLAAPLATNEILQIPFALAAMVSHDYHVLRNRNAYLKADFTQMAFGMGEEDEVCLVPDESFLAHEKDTALNKKTYFITQSPLKLFFKEKGEDKPLCEIPITMAASTLFRRSAIGTEIRAQQFAPLPAANPPVKEMTELEALIHGTNMLAEDLEKMGVDLNSPIHSVVSLDGNRLLASQLGDLNRLMSSHSVTPINHYQPTADELNKLSKDTYYLFQDKKDPNKWSLYFYNKTHYKYVPIMLCDTSKEDSVVTFQDISNDMLAKKELPPLRVKALIDDCVCFKVEDARRIAESLRALNGAAPTQNDLIAIGDKVNKAHILPGILNPYKAAQIGVADAIGKADELLKNVDPQLMANAPKDKFGRYVIGKASKNIQQNVVDGYKHKLNLLINAHMLLDKLGDMHSPILDFNPQQGLTSVLALTSVPKSFYEFTKQYKELFVDVDALDLIKIALKFSSAEDAKKYMHELLPINIEGIIKKAEENPFVSTIKNEAPGVSESVKNTKSSMESLNKILEAFSKNLPADGLAKKSIQDTILRIGDILTAWDSYARSPRGLLNLAELFSATGPQIAALIHDNSISQSYLALDLVFRNHIMTSAQQLHGMMEEIKLNIDSMEIEYCLKEGTLSSIAKVDSAMAEFQKLLGPSLGAQLKQQTLEAIAAQRKAMLSKVTAPQELLQRRIVTGEKAATGFAEAQAAKIKSETDEVHSQKRYLLNKFIDKRISVLTSRKRWFGRNNDVYVVTSLLEKLKDKMKGNHSIHTALDEIAKENPQDKKHIPLLWKGETGNVLKKLEFVTSSPADRINMLDLEIMRLEKRREKWHLFSSSLAELDLRISALQKLKVSINKPGNRLEDASNEMSLIHEAEFEALTAERGIAKYLSPVLWVAKPVIRALPRNTLLSDISEIDYYNSVSSAPPNIERKKIDEKIEKLNNMKGSSLLFYFQNRFIKKRINALQKLKDIVLRPDKPGEHKYFFGKALNELQDNNPSAYAMISQYDGDLIKQVLDAPNALIGGQKFASPVVESKPGVISAEKQDILLQLDGRIRELKVELANTFFLFRGSKEKEIEILQALQKHAETHSFTAAIDKVREIKGLGGNSYTLWQGKTGRMVKDIQYRSLTRKDMVRKMDLYLMRLHDRRRKGENVEFHIEALSHFKDKFANTADACSMSQAFAGLSVEERNSLTQQNHELLGELQAWENAKKKELVLAIDGEKDRLIALESLKSAIETEGVLTLDQALQKMPSKEKSFLEVNAVELLVRLHEQWNGADVKTRSKWVDVEINPLVTQVKSAEQRVLALEGLKAEVIQNPAATFPHIMTLLLGKQQGEWNSVLTVSEQALVKHLSENWDMLKAKDKVELINKEIDIVSALASLRVGLDGSEGVLTTITKESYQRDIDAILSPMAGKIHPVVDRLQSLDALKIVINHNDYVVDKDPKQAMTKLSEVHSQVLMHNEDGFLEKLRKYSAGEEKASISTKLRGA
jgi:hypothetical protein